MERPTWPISSKRAWTSASEDEDLTMNDTAMGGRRFFRSCLFILLTLGILPGCASLIGKNYSSLASYYFGKNDFKKAAEYLEKALQKDPDNEASLTMAGWTYFKLDQYDKALATFEKLAAEHPKAVEAYTGQGWGNFKKLNYDTAISFFQKALKVNRHSADAYAGLGWASFRKNDVTKAERYFENSLRKGMGYQSAGGVKTEPEAHRGLGYLNFAREDYPKAIRHFKTAVLFHPDWNDARMKLGDSLFALKKYDKAIPVYKRALHYAATPEVYDKIGWSYFYSVGEVKKGSVKNNKKFSKARKMFNKAIALDPNFANSLAGLAKLDAA